MKTPRICPAVQAETGDLAYIRCLNICAWPTRAQLQGRRFLELNC